ncbi:hypothetical protein SO802_023297 [Lithocarpus litseifolius]|uniref:Uncharacterized protein n=1 Tax=Lithocarpus litseifolius TaxID=425828 RepID=A0AAW2C5Z4_9ROSI
MVSLRLVLEHDGMVEKVNQDSEKPDIPIDLPSMDLWLDSCIQFAIKTLTGIGVDSPKGTKLSQVTNNRQQAKNVETTINGDKKQGCTAVLPSQDLAILVEHAEKVGNNCKDYEKPVSPLNMDLGDLWRDTCIECAKILRTSEATVAGKRLSQMGVETKEKDMRPGWYQAVFLSRVMLRKDCKKPYWKEKFIDASPFQLRTLAAEEHTTADINTTNKWNIMSSSASRKNKGKAPTQDYPQDKRIPTGQSFVMHEGASSRRNPSRSTSFQESVPAEVTFSSGDMEITLQEVISKILQYHNGNFSELPTPVKVPLNNLQATYSINHRKLFKKTLQALEIHLVNLFAQNEVYESLLVNLSAKNENYKKLLVKPISENMAFVGHSYEAFASHSIHHDLYTSQLFGKEEIHSTDKVIIMGTDYAKLSLKTQFELRCAIANLPSNIQKYILERKAMFRSFDLWYEYFKKLVTASIPNPDELDVDDNVFVQLNWEEYFRKSSRVYERKMHHFSGLLINYEDDELDAEDMDPDWLSQMFEFGFIRMIRVSNRDQIKQLPQIIQQAVAQTNSPYVTIRCWSTLPK